MSARLVLSLTVRMPWSVKLQSEMYVSMIDLLIKEFSGLSLAMVGATKTKPITEPDQLKQITLNFLSTSNPLRVMAFEHWHPDAVG